VRGALPVEEAVEYLLQACEAIAEAHALGIVHRDLKPANLFLVTRADGTPSVKVLDFGISKITGMGASGADLGMTKTTTIMGSPLYMSPEQMASSRDVDGRTDIWALGAILFELLTGRVPFQADTITQLCAMILQQNAEPLRNHRPDAPEGLQAVIGRCLEKDRTKRYSNVAELANALARYAPRRARLSVERVSRVVAASGLSISTHAVEESMPPSSHTDASTGAAWGATGTDKKGGGGKVAVIVGALLFTGVAAAGTVVILKKRGATPEPTATTQPADPPVQKQATASPNPTPTAPPPEVTPSVTSTAATAAPSAGVKPPPATTKNQSHVRPPSGGKTASPPPTAPPTVAPPPTAAATKPPKKSDLYGDRK
jgi:serine/threonine-protein kinase